MSTFAFRRAGAAVAAIALAGLAAGGFGYHQHQEHLAVLAVERDERVATAVSAAAAEQDFLGAADRQVQDEHVRRFAERLADRREQVADHVASYEGLAEDTDGEVADEQTHTDLAEAIGALGAEAPGAQFARLDQIPIEIDALAEEVEASHEEWVAEQERLRREREEEQRQEAERRAEQERAAQQATQQQTSESSANSNPSSSSSSNSSSATSGTSTTTGGQSRTSQAATIAARHGCADSGIIWDDPRLGATANGTADWFNNDILLRSSMPPGRLGYIVAHECAHMLQYRAYGGDVGAMEADMNAIYGGSGFSGLEQNADCMTHRWGYSAWNYTQNCSGDRGHAAAAIARGDRP